MAKVSVVAAMMTAKDVLSPLHSWAAARLEADVLPKFYKSPQYREMLSARHGRFWRVLRLCQDIIACIRTIENELLAPLEQSATTQSMLLVYNKDARAEETRADIQAIVETQRATCAEIRRYALGTARAAKRLFKRLELRDVRAQMLTDANTDDDDDDDE